MRRGRSGNYSRGFRDTDSTQRAARDGSLYYVSFGALHPLAIRSHFFEFLDDNGQLHLAHELVAGGEYQVVVTTSGGLYRYRLGDRVKVNGVLGRTPSLKFLGRVGIVSDQCGEKLSEAFVTRAVREASSPLLKPPRFALLAPEQCTGGVRYALFIEARVDGGLGARLDEALRENPNYRYCAKLANC